MSAHDVLTVMRYESERIEDHESFHGFASAVLEPLGPTGTSIARAVAAERYGLEPDALDLWAHDPPATVLNVARRIAERRNPEAD